MYGKPKGPGGRILFLPILALRRRKKRMIGRDTKSRKGIILLCHFQMLTSNVFYK